MPANTSAAMSSPVTRTACAVNVDSRIAAANIGASALCHPRMCCGNQCSTHTAVTNTAAGTVNEAAAAVEPRCARPMAWSTFTPSPAPTAAADPKIK
jgi:hypothetical protein